MTTKTRVPPRKATNTAGTIEIDGKEFPVVLRDASEAGVRLRVLRQIEVPDRFKLSVPMEKIDAECQVLWRRGKDIGVRFE